MWKYLLLLFIGAAPLYKSYAQSGNDLAREEFIEQITNYAKSQKYVQQTAEFKGGAGALYDYLQSHIVYPDQAKKEDLAAQVFVSFVIDWKTGLPRDVKIVQSSNELFDKEALRLVKTMPAWKPAQQDGNNVSMGFTIPIYFHLH